MPTYEYRCKACSRELEVVQSFTDDALTACEACGGQLRKLFGNVGIAFKGTGFYKNDSRDKVKTTSKDGDKSSSDNSSSDKSSSDKSSSDKSTGDKSSSDKSSGSKDAGSNGSKSTTPAPSGAKSPATSSPSKRS